MPEFQMPFEGIADRKAFNELDEFTKGYVKAIFFTECHGDNPEMESMTFADVAPLTLARIVDECRDFQRNNAASLADATDDSRKDPYDMRRAGTDFWFTRNGHGAGYWDRKLGDVGNAPSSRPKAQSVTRWV